MKNNKYLLLVLFFSFSLFFQKPVLAIEYGGIGGRPAYPDSNNPRTESIFIHNIKAGETQYDAVKVVNNTQESKVVMLYVVDSTPSTDGAFACKQFSEEKTGVGSWINLEKTELLLEPGTNDVVPFSISVPENVDTGEHNGCVIMQEKKENQNSREGVSLAVRTGLRVALVVPGEIIRKLEFSDFSLSKKENGDYVLRPVIKNSGNVSIDTDVNVVTKYFFGKTLFHHKGQYPVLRGETSSWNFELKKPFWGGWYESNFYAQYDFGSSAGVGLSDEQTLRKIEGQTIWFFSYPEPLAMGIELGILFLLIFVIYLFVLSKKRKNWIKKEWEIYSVLNDENINAVAKKFNVSWRLLAKVNKIKAPYIIKAGDRLKVPPK